MSDETDPYLEVARRFFNEFLEMKVSLDRDGAVSRRQQDKIDAKHEKEVEKWKDANAVLKVRLQNFAEENQALSNTIASLEDEVENLNRTINEIKMRGNQIAVKMRDYPLDQHMSQEAYEEWVKIRNLMTQAPGTTKGRDNAP